MKVAVDLDRTAFAWPCEFQLLILHLLAGGDEVVFLTAADGELPPDSRPAEVSGRVEARLQAVKNVEIVCCESRERREWLRRNEFDLLIDDNSVEGCEGLRLCPTAANSSAFA